MKIYYVAKQKKNYSVCKTTRCFSQNFRRMYRNINHRRHIFGLMLWLIIWECTYYLETDFTFKFKADADFKEKIKLNVIITVAMPCHLLGADIMDSTGAHLKTYEELTLTNTWFELDPDQLIHFQGTQRANIYLREEFHSIHHILWRSGYINLFGGLPERKVFPKRPKDACKISGSVTLNKVAGNFHVTAGKSLPIPGTHAHISMFLDESDYNFTHRIEKFSFGDPAPGIIHPLEGDEQVTEQRTIAYQYFLDIVPTKVNTYRYFGNSYQYSVSEQQREISHSTGSHGTPGIFFKYDTSALKVEVLEQHEPFLQFVTRLVGIIGGVFTCSGLIHRFLGFIADIILCRYFRLRSSSLAPKKKSVASPSVQPLLLGDHPSPQLNTSLLTPGAPQPCFPMVNQDFNGSIIDLKNPREDHR